jgi:hypothetical protein
MAETLSESHATIKSEQIQKVTDVRGWRPPWRGLAAASKQHFVVIKIATVLGD